MIDMLFASTILADSWHGGHAWWPLLWLLWLSLIGLLIFLFARRGRSRTGGDSSAEAILGERYARGEIDAEQYRERLDELRRHLRS
jgi:putative membrane protein